MIQKIGSWFRRMIHRKPIVPTPSPTPGPYPPNKGVYVTRAQLLKIATDTLGDRYPFIVARPPLLWDTEYYLPSVEYTKLVVANDQTDAEKYITNKGDCDKFSKLLWARFTQDAWKDGKLRAAHAFGMIWGRIPGPGGHAICWVVNDDRRMRFIEPQTDLYEDISKINEVWGMAA